MKISNISSETDQGPRNYQEDSFLAGPIIFAVADGLGGHPNGDKASQIVISKLSKITIASKEKVSAAITEAEKECLLSGDGRGTTVAVAYLTDKKLHVHWSGDSRVYIWTKNRGLECLTKDQGLGYMLYHFIGYDAEYSQEYKQVELDSETLVFLTTDGIHDYINMNEAILNSKKHKDNHSQYIIDLAKKSTKDNCTIVSFKVS